jgi:hypothetical protein
MRLIQLELALALSLPLNCALGYEVHTHAKMTQEAFERSLIPQSTMLGDLGIYGGDGKLLLLQRYWDIGSADTRLRAVDESNPRDTQVFESRVLGDISISTQDNLSVIAWAFRGAVREDDIGRRTLFPSLLRPWIKNPYDDPYFPSLVRPVHHFYDPIANRALTNSSVTAIDPAPQKAPDWALGVSDAFALPLVADASRRNHFSIADAREAMWRALTGTRLSNGTTEAVAPTVEERKRYWATAFRALGGAMHLLQDMAQPQHTRNDSHAGVPLFGEASQYELRINARVLGTEQGTTTPYLPRIDFGAACYDPGGLCPVDFGSYSDYFSTRQANPLARNGLADYSNRGFFTVGTNLGQNEYAFPPNDEARFSVERVTGVDGRLVETLVGSVPDNVFPAQIASLTSRSAFDLFTTEWGTIPVYFIAPENIDAMAKLLLPRAVAYSAGFLNYFFRGIGKIEIQLPEEKVYAVEDFATYAQFEAGFQTLKLRVKNNTPPAAGQPQASGAGKLIAVLSYRRNRCLTFPSLLGAPVRDPADPTGQRVIWDESCRTPSLEAEGLPEIVASAPIPVPDGFDSALQTVVFTFAKPLPFDATDVDLQVIYRGPLGAEPDAIALGWENISEPGFVNIDNNYDCFTGNDVHASCGANPTDAKCLISTSIKLPFYFAADQPGWRAVASVTNLRPGQYARVAYLTRSAMRPDFDTERLALVTTNQRFAYDMHISYVDGTSEDWPKKVPVTTPFERSRKLAGQDQPTMFAWAGSFGSYQDQCPTGTCSKFEWANQCPAISPMPQPVTLSWPYAP